MDTLVFTLAFLLVFLATVGAKNKITTESAVCDMADVAEEVATVCSDKCGPYTTDISQQDFNCYAVCALPILGWEVSNEALDDVEDELMANQDFLNWLISRFFVTLTNSIKRSIRRPLICYSKWPTAFIP